MLSYRGSTSLRNWLGNLDLELTGFLPCKDCQVHRGFLSSWNDSKDTVRNTLARARADHPDYSIIFTGHSLGAAIVTLAAAELRQQGFNIALVSCLAFHDCLLTWYSTLLDLLWLVTLNSPRLLRIRTEATIVSHTNTIQFRSCQATC